MSAQPTTRDHNKVTVLDVVLDGSPLTRSQVIERTGLSKATVSRAVEELRADGFLVQEGVDDAGFRGRPSAYLDVPAGCGHVVGLSFGVQTTSALATDLRGREIGYVAVPTDGPVEVDAVAARLAALTRQVGEAASGPLVGVCVALPARIRGGTHVVRPASPLQALAGAALHTALGDALGTQVALDSDANLSLLTIVTEDAEVENATLFSVNSILNVATCANRELLRGRTATFGDLGLLASGVAGRSLDSVLSTRGLLGYARAFGLDIADVEDLWLGDDVPARAEVLEAVTTALVTAVTTVGVTLDPDRVYFVGRLQPLVEQLLPGVRAQLKRTLGAVPRIEAIPLVIGRATAQGAVYSALATAQKRLLEVVLTARHLAQVRSEPVHAFWAASAGSVAPVR